jgi:hypothetical protein
VAAASLSDVREANSRQQSYTDNTPEPGEEGEEEGGGRRESRWLKYEFPAKFKELLWCCTHKYTHI